MARRLDSEFEGMLHEDHSAVANLPQEVIQKTYPKCEYMDYNVDDTIRGVDENIDSGVRKLKEHRSKSMY